MYKTNTKTEAKTKSDNLMGSNKEKFHIALLEREKNYSTIIILHLGSNNDFLQLYLANAQLEKVKCCTFISNMVAFMTVSFNIPF